MTLLEEQAARDLEELERIARERREVRELSVSLTLRSLGLIWCGFIALTFERAVRVPLVCTSV